MMTLLKTPSVRRDGSRALVTGARRGIGRAAASALMTGPTLMADGGWMAG